MRVVIAVQALVNPAGTETYVLVVARELQRLGHEVVVAAEQLGPMAAHVEAQGIVVARDRAELPATCDAILANDAICATSFAALYPGVRLVQVAHSELFDHQLPVLLPGVVDAVVVCSDRAAARVRALALDVHVVRLRLPVDADRFAGNGALPTRPRRALIVSNYLTGERRRALVDAWHEQGVACTQIGALDEAVLDPSVLMRDADIVVGKAVAALEGMACGRAVYVYDQFGGDGWVTPATYPAFEADNLAGLSSPAPRTPAQLAADLRDYDPDMGWLNEELIRTHHSARRHANELVGVLRGEHVSSPAPASVLAEVTRLTRVAWGANQRALSVEHELAALRKRVLAADAQVADREHVARESEQHLERAQNAERELAAWTVRAQNAERELAAWTVRAQNAERELAAWTVRAQNAERELAAWTVRAQDAERELAAWTVRAQDAERELAAWTVRAQDAERELAEARRLLGTRRVRVGLAAGRALDRLRGRA